MKTFLSVLSIFVFFEFGLSAQEIQFPASILSAGGEEESNGPSHVSKWRIGQVNVLEIKSKELKGSTITFIERTDKFFYRDLEILAYPNPVTDILKVKFEMKESEYLEISVTDITGRKMLERKIRQILPDETLELDFNELNSALYFLNIWSKDKTLVKSVKISKQ